MGKEPEYTFLQRGYTYENMQNTTNHDEWIKSCGTFTQWNTTQM